MRLRRAKRTRCLAGSGGCLTTPAGVRGGSPGPEPRCCASLGLSPCRPAAALQLLHHRPRVPAPPCLRPGPVPGAAAVPALPSGASPTPAPRWPSCPPAALLVFGNPVLPRLASVISSARPVRNNLPVAAAAPPSQLVLTIVSIGPADRRHRYFPHAALAQDMPVPAFVKALRPLCPTPGEQRSPACAVSPSVCLSFERSLHLSSFLQSQPWRPFASRAGVSTASSPTPSSAVYSALKVPAM